jgi:ubiquinone/menaquinone biosynthesis C-methylase UbiE
METVLSCHICRSDQIHVVDQEWNFCRCGSCGYVFDSPRFTIDELVAFYSQPAKYDSWINETRARDALWKRRLKKLLPHKVTGNLLDVGTGIGQFLHQARPFFADVQGTEVSDSAIRIAREKYGLEIHQGQVEELDLPAESFDNITLFHVLEHVRDPVQLAQRCRTLLRPSGILIMAVPNDVLAWTSKLKKLGKKLGLRPFQKFSPVLGISKAGSSREIHLSHFTSSVLRGLLERAGFSILEESLDPYYASAGLRRAVDALYFAFHRLLLAALKINRYDTIWIVCRKAEANPL